MKRHTDQETHLIAKRKKEITELLAREAEKRKAFIKTAVEPNKDIVESQPRKEEGTNVFMSAVEWTLDQGAELRVRLDKTSRDEDKAQ